MPPIEGIGVDSVAVVLVVRSIGVTVVLLIVVIPVGVVVGATIEVVIISDELVEGVNVGKGMLLKAANVAYNN